MAKLDSVKEELGWLKVVFAVLVAIDASLIAWVSQTYRTATGFMVAIAMLAVAAADCVRDLGQSSRLS